MSFLPWELEKIHGKKKTQPTTSSSRKPFKPDASRQPTSTRQPFKPDASRQPEQNEGPPKVPDRTVLDRRDTDNRAPGRGTPTAPITHPNGFRDFGWVNPVPGAAGLTDFGSFGAERAYRNGWHQGIDLNGSEGTPILSIQGGQVTFVGSSKGYGGLKVVVDHGNGWESRYYHIKEGGFLVREGDMVEPGSPIAMMGSTGHTSVSHLHFELWKDGNAVDPVGSGVLANTDLSQLDPSMLKAMQSGARQVAVNQRGGGANDPTNLGQGFIPGGAAGAGRQMGEAERMLMGIIDSMSLFVAGGQRSNFEDVARLRLPQDDEVLEQEELDLIPVGEADLPGEGGPF